MEKVYPNQAGSRRKLHSGKVESSKNQRKCGLSFCLFTVKIQGVQYALPGAIIANNRCIVGIHQRSYSRALIAFNVPYNTYFVNLRKNEVIGVLQCLT